MSSSKVVDKDREGELRAAKNDDAVTTKEVPLSVGVLLGVVGVLLMVLSALMPS